MYCTKQQVTIDDLLPNVYTISLIPNIDFDFISFFLINTQNYRQCISGKTFTTIKFCCKYVHGNPPPPP